MPPTRVVRRACYVWWCGRYEDIRVRRNAVELLRRLERLPEAQHALGALNDLFKLTLRTLSPPQQGSPQS